MKTAHTQGKPLRHSKTAANQTLQKVSGHYSISPQLNEQSTSWNNLEFPANHQLTHAPGQWGAKGNFNNIMEN